MTVRDACDVNTLLRHLLNSPRAGTGPVDAGAARGAAARLASRANAALSAGLTGGEVEALWNQSPPRPAAPKRKP